MSENTSKYSVSFPHTGADGKARKVGDVVSLTEDEARVRLADGFVQPVAAAKAAEKADAKASEK